MLSKSVIFTAIGEPRDVLRVIESAVQTTESAPILVRMTFCPINPADGLRIRGKFGFSEQLPAVVGGEGVGLIQGFHDGFDHVAHGLNVGDVCILPFGGTWSQLKAVRPDEVVVMPSHIDLQQLSMFGINAASAFFLLKATNLQSGDWLIQNAANSAVGKLIIQFAKKQGIKTINVVRRSDVVEELYSLGADVVVLDGDDLKQQIQKATNEQPISIKVALDAVAGSASGRLVDTLAFGGRLIVYGLLSDSVLTLPATRIAFHSISVGGFSRMAYLRQLNVEARKALFAELAQWFSEGLFQFQIEKVFPIEEVVQAFESSEISKHGKILLSFN